MSQYSNAQPALKLEVAQSQGGGSGESVHPTVFDGKSEKGSGSKLGAVTAGHSSKVGKTA